MGLVLYFLSFGLLLLGDLLHLDQLESLLGVGGLVQLLGCLSGPVPMTGAGSSLASGFQSSQHHNNESRQCRAHLSRPEGSKSPAPLFLPPLLESRSSSSSWVASWRAFAPAELGDDFPKMPLNMAPGQPAESSTHDISSEERPEVVLTEAHPSSTSQALIAKEPLDIFPISARVQHETLLFLEHRRGILLIHP